MPSPARRAVRLAVALLALAGCAGRGGEAAPGPEPADRVRYARRMLEEVRAFEQQGRPEAAERAARRGLEATPDDAALLRGLARALGAQGRAAEATRAAAQAERLDPPPPEPPLTPVAASSRNLLVVLLPPDPAEADPERIPQDWPDAVVAETLERRLQLRLPEATLASFEPETVAEARRWIAQHSPRAVVSLRVERAFCDTTVKDGAFALAWLRLASERPGPPRGQVDVLREVVNEPRLAGGCRREATARALERVLESPGLQAALDAPELPAGLRSPVVQQASWSREAIRALFPGLGRRLQAELDAGRRWIESGQVAKAAEAFHRAAHIDPEDPDVQTYIGEADATLAMAAELAPDDAGGQVGVLEPRFTAAQRAGAEARLAEEQRRREDLLAALAVLDEDLRVPSPRTLRALRRVEIRDPSAFGPALARARAGRAIEARVAYAPDGSVLTTYFFPEGEAQPVLRQEDTRGDGRADRWIGYEDGARREIWEDTRGRGEPGVRLVFVPGGNELERVELDSDGDGRLDQLFSYQAGVLSGESRDSDGDGVLDTFDRLDAAGALLLRDEDVNGDGRIDVRSYFRGGRLVRRELTDPALTPGGT